MKPGKVILLLGLIAALSLSTGCGSKRNPTGGPVDSEKPVLISSAPAELGTLNKGILEIDFSKAMDKSSVTNSVYIYPPVLNRKITLSKATLRIEINETLKPDTFYFVTLTTRLKDQRNNPLDKPYTLTFKSGKPEPSRISGRIAYENDADQGLPIQLSLFSPDSLLIRMDQISGASYALDNLNPAAHRLRAYIDKDQNGRYDQSLEPYFEGLAEAGKIQSLDLNLAYVDTTWAQIRSVQEKSRHELELTFSKPITSYVGLQLKPAIGSDPQIIQQYLRGDKLILLTTALDSTRYTLEMQHLRDAKGNISPKTGISFFSQGKPDDNPPRILSTTPRTGASVNSLRPEFEIYFSEIIPREKFQARLIAADSKTEIPLEVTSVTGRTVKVRPVSDLTNYRSHTLKILKTTTDYSGNPLDQDYDLVFLPIKRN